MGTTLVTLLCDDRQALWGHVGDSRLYAFRDGCLIHQTRDHSVPQLLVNAGEIAPDAVRDHEDRARLLQALGTEGRLRPEIPLEPLIVQAGDAFLLCTDGFWEHVLEAEMESALAGAATPAAWLQAMEAVHRGRAPTDCDNHTALAVYLRVP
jgi:serine/threonine protein phosphatase PrpC